MDYELFLDVATSCWYIKIEDTHYRFDKLPTKFEIKTVLAQYEECKKEFEKNKRSRWLI